MQEKVIAFVIFWILILKWGLYENKMSRKRNNTAHKYTVYTCTQTADKRSKGTGVWSRVTSQGTLQRLLHSMVFEKKYYSSLFKIGITSLNKPTRDI